MKALIFAAGWILGAVTVISWGYVLAAWRESQQPVVPEMFKGWNRCQWCQGLFAPMSSDARQDQDYCCVGCEETAWLEKHLDAKV